MKLEYKGKKWDKEVDRIQKYLKEINGVFNTNELSTINKFLNSQCKDYLRLYNSLLLNYERMAAYHY